VALDPDTFGFVGEDQPQQAAKITHEFAARGRSGGS
jgi:hypothetical protein